MTSTTSQLPAPGDNRRTHFILIEPKPDRGGHRAPLVTAWNRAIDTYFVNESDPPFTVLEGKLEELEANLLECDCVVFPANSFGIMDGG
jgi:general stress protein 26